MPALQSGRPADHDYHGLTDGSRELQPGATGRRPGGSYSGFAIVCAVSR